MTSSEEKVSYQRLVVWQKAHELALFIYRETQNFPKDEIYGITSQLRRAALSVPTNIVEGYARQGKNELKRFLTIALGSLSETEYLLFFSQKLGYFNPETYQKIKSLRGEVGALLWKYSKNT
jgi:four helix bundle protein